MKLVRIHEGDLEHFLPLINHYIEDATNRSAGRHTPKTVYEMIQRDLYHLWLVVDDEQDNQVQAVVVTQFLQYPTGITAADVIIATGQNRKKWLHLLEELEDWARDNHCDLFQMFARKGWAREIPQYNLSHVLLERQLDE